MNKRPSAYDEVRKIIVSSNDNPIEGLQTVLESLVDKYSINKVVALLAEVAEAKAEHIRVTWQDDGLANRWGKISLQLAKTAHELPRGQ